MKKTVSLAIIFFILLSAQVFASDFTLNIKGRTVDPSGNLEPIYGIEARINEQSIYPANGTNLVDDGSFWFKDIEFNNDDHLWIILTGKCIYRFLNITYNGTEFEVMDLQTNEIINHTSSTEINLGDLSENTPNMFFVNSDTPVTYELYNENKSQSLGGMVAYVTDNGNSDIFATNTDYFVVLTDKDGKEWSSPIHSGSYCTGTQLIKRGDTLTTASCQQNECEPIQEFPLFLFIGVGIVVIIIIIIGIVLLKKKKKSKVVVWSVHS